jgi:DNA-binding MarR family transcriptional regulator/GNAT superfamily N-acetyltransferase
MNTIDQLHPVEAVRHFNRFYTRKIGLLNEGLLDSNFSLTEARVLYELAHGTGLTATDLIRELDLDAGYLSRMLARFERLRLIARHRSKEDARQTRLTLTPHGRKVFAPLNRRSSAQVGQLIGHLSETEKSRLGGLMHSVQQLLSPTPGTIADVVLRAPQPGDFGWVVQRHGALYAEEYGWNQDFEVLVASIVADYGTKRDERRERCWIAEIDQQPVGSVFLVRKTDTVGKLRLLLVEPSARGRGVGHRLIEACISLARSGLPES